MLVIPALAGAVVALVAGNPVVAIGLACIAVCDWLGELHQRDLERHRVRSRRRV